MTRMRSVGRKERKRRKVKTRKFTTKDTKITKVGRVIIRTLRDVRGDNDRDFLATKGQIYG